LFGELIRGHRQRQAMTQEELAARAGISARHIRDLEAGRIIRPRPSTVRLVADALGLGRADRERFQEAAAGPTGEVVPDTTPGVVSDGPAQLPTGVHGFAGRSDELAQLDAATAAGERSDSVVLLLSGTAGVGKTALAVHWARRIAGRFPDGQLYVNLGGFGPGGEVVSPAAALCRFLDALGVPADRLPADLDAQAALYRGLLTGRRVLVLLDNARDADQVRPLLPASPGCLVIVTSRDQLAGLVATHGARPLTVDLPAPAEAREVLARRLGPQRVAAEQEAADEIVARCARLPLALAVVAARAAAHPGFPLSALVAELRETDGGLDALAGGDAATDLRSVFSWSYGALTKAAARLFRLLGLHPGPDISPPAAASLASAPLPRTRQLLAELARANLVSEHVPGRYAMHDLLHAYAAELARTVDPRVERDAACHRLLDHYLHTADLCAALLDPYRKQISIPPAQPGVCLERPADSRQAIDWFAAERPVVIAAVAHAAGTGFDSHAWQLAWTVATFLQAHYDWYDLTRLQRIALTAARRTADRAGLAHAHYGLGRAYARQGRNGPAYIHLRQAQHRFRELDDRTGQAYAHLSLAAYLERLSRHREALAHGWQALDLCRALGNQAGQARALNTVGWFLALLGKHDQAFTPCQQALDLALQVKDRSCAADAWDSLGYLNHRLGNHRQAIDCYRNTLRIQREMGRRFCEAETLDKLGDAELATGDAPAARIAWQQALDILDRFRHPAADRVRVKLDDRFAAEVRA
jgi:tetratricopeptide (TPR) repeat protein/DNA-binding XRE family transcriptional regulator